MAQENGWFKCAMKERNEKKAKILYDFLDEQALQGYLVEKRTVPDERTVRHRRYADLMPCLSRKPKCRSNLWVAPSAVCVLASIMQCRSRALRN